MMEKGMYVEGRVSKRYVSVHGGRGGGEGGRCAWVSLGVTDHDGPTGQYSPALAWSSGGTSDWSEGDPGSMPSTNKAAQHGGITGKSHSAASIALYATNSVKTACQISRIAGPLINLHHTTLWH